MEGKTVVRNTILRSIRTKSAFAFLSAAFVVSLVAAATFSLVQPKTVSAASCDTVNIIHCGLEGSSLSGNIDSFQKFYNKNSDNGHNDLQEVYKWSGVSSTDVKNMTTTNTKLGTLYRNGEVKVGNDVVANDAWVSARFTNGSGFTKVKDGVWARKTTTSFANASVPALVHYDGNGQVDWVVMVNCGNAVKVTPVKQTPKPALVCTSLKATPATELRTYSFTAQATATNTKIVSYTFNYGDGKTETVTTADAKVTRSHTFADNDKSYNVTVSVNGTDLKNVTSPDCATTIKTAQMSLVCTSLKAEKSSATDLTYNLTATATATNTTISSYTFNYGDGKTETVASSDASVSRTHTYVGNDKTFNATVAVSGKDFSNVTSTACATAITTPKPEECKPGIPLGDTRCAEECKPGIPVGSAECEETPPEEVPEELVNTGPAGVVGIFAGTSALGALGHRLFRRLRRGE